METLNCALRAILITLVLCGIPGCGGDEFELAVDLVTDYLPGRQFGSVRVDVYDTASGALLQTNTTVATSPQDYLRGVRLADFDGLSAGTLTTRVVLVGSDGSVLASQETLVEFRSSRATTVRISALCRTVMCPDGDDSTLTACLGGFCVDPRCTPETPEYCGDAGCFDDVQCRSTSACTEGACIGGICFVRSNDSSCEVNEYCDIDRGCLLNPDELTDAGLADAGPADSSAADVGLDSGSCASAETVCGDGADDDCDGDIDCADSDCNDVACDDASLCTEGDRCTGGICTGEPLDCSDGDTCTDDGCDSATGCTHLLNTAPCDDGSWCNGTDTCAAGVCTHVDPPCPDFCTEATRTCERCRVASDCGTVVDGDWGACGGFTEPCGNDGMQTRSVASPTCDGGTCGVVLSEEPRACTRNTSGNSCSAPTFGPWGACGGFADCATAGVETRTQTNYACQSGSCGMSTQPNTRPCSRTVTDSTECELGHCCGGSCTDTTTSSNCGSCSVSCGGRSCRAVSGEYHCDCGADHHCWAILDSNATCAMNGDDRVCVCACPGAATSCLDGGCGPGFSCQAGGPMPFGYCAALP